MADKNSKNEGIRTIADFTDRAVPLNGESADRETPESAAGAVNEGIHVIADFKDQARPLNGTRTDAGVPPTFTADQENADVESP